MRTKTRIAGSAAAASMIAVVAVELPAWGGLVPGGGSERSDCYVELLVQDVDSPGPQIERNRIVSCTDGDACDGDGHCGNGACDFSIAVCVSQADPSLPSCSPAPVQRLTGRARRLGVLGRDFARDHVPRSSLLQSTFPVETGSGAVCVGGMTVDVRLRRGGGGQRPGSLAISIDARAASGVIRARDRDWIVLRCLPRTSECPGAE